MLNTVLYRGIDTFHLVAVVVMLRKEVTYQILDFGQVLGAKLSQTVIFAVIQSYLVLERILPLAEIREALLHFADLGLNLLMVVQCFALHLLWFDLVLCRA